MAEVPSRRCKSEQHWSGVDRGVAFELVIDFDAAIYSQAQVVVPFHRRLADGLSCCEELGYTANGQAGDSKYHITKAIRARVAPPRIGERPKKQPKLYVATSMTNFFAVQPKPPSPHKEQEAAVVDQDMPTPTPMSRSVPLSKELI